MMNTCVLRFVALLLAVPFALTAAAISFPPPPDGTYDEFFHGDGSDDSNNPTPLMFGFPNPNVLRGSVAMYHDWEDNFSFTVGAGETIEAINLTELSGFPFLSMRLRDGNDQLIHDDTHDGSDLNTNVLGNSTLDPGDYKIWLHSYSTTSYEFMFVYTAIENFAAGELLGGAAQVGIQNGSHQFQLLSSQLHGIVNGISNLSGAGGNFVSLPQAAASSDVRLVSYEDTDVEQVAYQQSRSVRRRSNQNSPILRGGWDGWVQGYGIGGQVQGSGGVAGLDYRAGGTQLGIYRLASDGTLIGLFGAYGNQNVETNDNSEANINSGMAGAFLYRGDHLGNYYILAGNAAYDDYDTSRAGGIRGDFGGVQSGAYLERGWTRQWNGLTVQPNLALQYIWVHQDDHIETGVGGTSVDDVDAHSLRSIVGANVQGDALAFRRGRWWWTPNTRVHWMHEYLDTSTSVTGSLSGSSFTAEGLDLGRDWAVLGVGLSGDRNRVFSLYGNYDLQINDRQTFHTGSGGIVWSR